MVKLNSYINFDGNTREAMEFYKTIFGGELFFDTFEKYSGQFPFDEADKDHIMHSYLRGDNGIELMAADIPSSMKLNGKGRIVLTLSGEDETTLRNYWDKLAADGSVTMPLAAAPWGATFGAVTDKYDIDWMINIGPEQEQ